MRSYEHLGIKVQFLKAITLSIFLPLLMPSGTSTHSAVRKAASDINTSA